MVLKNRTTDYSGKSIDANLECCPNSRNSWLPNGEIV